MTSAYESGGTPPILMRHRLRIARENAGYDQEQLAAEIGVARNTIYNAEKGKVAPRRIVLKAWALACGVRLSWLLTGEEAPAAAVGNDPKLSGQTESNEDPTRQPDGLVAA